jgi:phosphatidylserine/phosphatidylglycerophosphate/cardiolipin synthase-like enzyme
MAKADLTRKELLPTAIAGMPVDVRQASSYQRLRDLDPLAAQISQAYGRPEELDPTWPLEREVQTGRLLTSSASQMQTRLVAQQALHPAASRALAQAKHQLPYRPVGCPPLTAMDITANITVAVSPDCGFSTLSKFLSSTATGLKVGMYDFTSEPILALVEKALPAPRSLQMVLDSPAPNETLDQTDWATVSDLRAILGDRAKVVRSLSRQDRFADAWSFPYAYHIKVIVRDGDALWLSSGNLNNSNEPAPNHPKTVEDRDWHVIVEEADLAGLFAAYLDFDYNIAARYQTPDPEDVERAIEAARTKRLQQTDPTGHRVHSEKGAPTPPLPAPPVASKVFPAINLTVTPLLTPDKLVDGLTPQYLSEISTLIRGAKRKIYIQLQYIEAASGAAGDPYSGLLRLIAERKQQDNLDVRLIVSANYAEKWGEKMRAGKTGVDLTPYIRTLPNVHNKGFVVDSETIIVSSQNFSPAGVTDNRDAGLMMKSAELAGYFEPIFLADWARSKELSLRSRAKAAPAHPGLVRGRPAKPRLAKLGA